MPSWYDDELAELRRQGLYRSRRRIQSPQQVRVRQRGRELLNFSSNDYLNLAADPRLARAAARAAKKYGAGAGSSPLVSGWLPPLRTLERALARWERTEAALVFPSGFAANLGAVSALGQGAVIFSDELNHASLIDGCRLARAPVHVYGHGDVEHLEALLRTHGAAAPRRLIVTDTVFSMDGDLAPLAELLRLAERFDCQLLVDEAHATGVLGEQGQGVSALLASGGRQPAVVDQPTVVDRLIKVGTLSKALGAQGGFVCGTRSLISYLVNKARPYIFSTALAPPAAAAARRAVAVVREEPERRRHLLRLADMLRQELLSLGFPATRSQCQIVPVLIGDPEAAVSLSKRLEEDGLLVPAIRPPSVPTGTSRLRISLTAGHTEEDVGRLIGSLARRADRTRQPLPAP